MADYDYFIHYLFRLSENNLDNLIVNCLDENTLIKTITGNKRIKDFKKSGEIIYAYDKKMGEVRKSKSFCFYKGKQNTIKIITTDGQVIKATKNHKLFVCNKSIRRKKVKYLKQGDNLVCISQQGIAYTTRVVLIKKEKKSKVYDLYVPKYNNFILTNSLLSSNSAPKGMGKSTNSIWMCIKYLKFFGYRCPSCGKEFYKNLWKLTHVNGKATFTIPQEIITGKWKIRCPDSFELDLRTGLKKKVSGCGKIHSYRELGRIKWEAKRFIAYDNGDVINKIFSLPQSSPLICLGAGTNIIVKEGEKITYDRQIQELVGKENFKVLTYNQKENIYEFKKPEKCIETHKLAEVYTIELENGKKLIATEDHLILTKTGYKKVKELTEDDEIKMHSRNCKVCGKEFIPQEEQNIHCSAKCYDVTRQKKRITDPIEKEKVRIRRRLYRLNNKEIIKERKKKDYIKHRESYLAKNREYHKNNRKKVTESTRKWISNNLTRYRAYINNRHKTLMETSPTYRITRNLRRRVNLALRDQGMIKDNSLKDYLGCSVDELKTYLTSLFKEGMNWENYGSVWSVDHIIPCVKFDLTKKENQKSCFNYKNLQPLWCEENSRKGGKLVY